MGRPKQSAVDRVTRVQDAPTAAHGRGSSTPSAAPGGWISPYNEPHRPFVAAERFGFPMPPDAVDYGTLDPGIREYVKFLRAMGVDTWQSCQGGPGHSSPLPKIVLGPSCSFGQGHRALAIAMEIGMPVLELRLSWTVTRIGPDGPHWELVFSRRCDE